MPSAGQWRWPALTMFTVGYGANQFVPLLAVYRRTLALTDTQATAVFGVYALGLDGCRWVAPQQPTLDCGVQRGLAGGVDPAQRFRPDGTLPLVVTAGDGDVHRLEMVGSYRAQPVVTQVWDQVLVDVASVGQSGRGAQ